jgi:hypothetical protein
MHNSDKNLQILRDSFQCIVQLLKLLDTGEREVVAFSNEQVQRVEE